jgi:hypothetical protein
MTAQKKTRSPKAKAEAPKVVEAPKEPVVEEVKVEAKAEPEPEITSAPVKVEEPKRMKLEAYERPETNQHEDEPKWVKPDHNISQHLYGSGRLKHRMRTRKSRYE